MRHVMGPNYRSLWSGSESSAVSHWSTCSHFYPGFLDYSLCGQQSYVSIGSKLEAPRAGRGGGSGRGGWSGGSDDSSSSHTDEFRFGYGAGSGGRGGSGRGGRGGSGRGGGSGGSKGVEDSDDPSWSKWYSRFGYGFWQSSMDADPLLSFEYGWGWSMMGLRASGGYIKSGLSYCLHMLLSALLTGSIIKAMNPWFSSTKIYGTSSMHTNFSAFPSRPSYSRLNRFLYKGTVFAAFWFGSGLLATAISNEIEKMRREMDPNYEAPQMIWNPLILGPFALLPPDLVGDIVSLVIDCLRLAVKASLFAVRSFLPFFP